MPGEKTFFADLIEQARIAREGGLQAGEVSDILESLSEAGGIETSENLKQTAAIQADVFNVRGGFETIDPDFVLPEKYGGKAVTGDLELGTTDVTQVYGQKNIQTSSQDLGISTGAVGSREELQRMLSSYKGRTSLIQSAQRQKAIYTIDRFDGGINLNKAPRDLSYWEAAVMDCLSPSKIGRLIRLGDFSAKISASSGNGLESFQQDSEAVYENYGLHYFKLSDSISGTAGSPTFADETPTNYIAIQDNNDINIWNLGNSEGVNDTTIPNLVTGFNSSGRPVYHSIANRVYISDATFDGTNSWMFGIVDRRKLFPYTDGTIVSYGKTGNSINFINQNLYHAAPVAGITGDGNVCVTTNSTGYANNATTHNGIYINAQFANITDDSAGTGWGGTSSVAGSGDEVKYYKFYASWLYDDGSETKLTDVTGHDNTHADIAADPNVEVVTATTGTSLEYQKLVVKQVLIDGTELFTNFPRVHGARFYYTETDSSGNPEGSDKYLWAELDFRYGFKLMSEFGHWNLFEDDRSAALAYIQVKNAADTDGDTTPDGTLSINSPPRAFTFYTLNLFHQEEMKSDLQWKTSTMGNGIAFIGNIYYDERDYTDTMLYSGAGETDAGSAYPMWGTFPVDSNRIDIPGAAGEITALKWVANRVLQFRQNAMYVINVEDVLAPKVEGVYQGMGVHGQWAVTETPFGVAWVNDNGVYAYNADAKKVRSLTIGRLDTEDFQSGGANLDKTKIGYDDRAKMLIITNTSNVGAAGYHYAYSFVTDAWSTWDEDKGYAANVKTNFAIDHDGYLTGAVDSGTTINVYKWSASAQAAQTIDYVTKDIDFGKPGLDKRFYTLYISFTGGASQASLFVYFRVNGIEGADSANGWTKLSSIQDYTNPYSAATGISWGVPVISDLDVSSGTATVTTSVAHGLSVGDTIYIDASNDTYDESKTVASVADSTHFTYTTSQSDVTNLTGYFSSLTGDAVVPTAVDDLDSTDTTYVQKLAKINLRALSGSLSSDYLKFARSIQFRIKGTAATTFEINDISLVYKEKRIK